MRGLHIGRVGEHRDLDGTTRVLVRGPKLQAGNRVVVTRLPNAMDGLRLKIADDQ